MNKSFLSGSSIFLLAVMFIVINGISDRVFNRFHIDLTEEGLYTLSQGSKDILAGLSVPVNLKLYYSKTEGDKFPIIKLYGARIADLLKEYARKSGGKITLEVFDPRPDSEDEEWAEKYGVTPMDLPTGERVFLGLVAISSLGTEDVIPVFNLGRQEFLEYDITKMLYSLSSGAQPVIGILSPLNVTGQPSGVQFPPQQLKGDEKPWIFVSQLSKLAEVRRLPMEVQKIPDEVTTLFVIHPRGMSELTRYAVDQFVMKGGNVFIAVDPFCMSDSPPSDPSNPMANFTVDRSSELNDLMSPWGISLRQGKVVGDIRLATLVATQRDRQENFIAWLSLQRSSTGDSADLIDSQDVITNGMSSVMLPWSGALELSKVDSINQTVLFQTSKDAMLFEEKDIRFMAEDPKALLKKYNPGTDKLPLAVKLTGIFPSSFEKRPGSEEAPVSSDGGHVPRSVKPATVVVIADVDFMADSYSAMSQRIFGTEIVSFLNDNINLVSNIAENLSGDNSLISLRSRGRFTRPFLKVQQIEAEAQRRYQNQEQEFQAALNRANQRLSELQSGLKNSGMSGESSQTVLNQALLDQIDALREEKRDLQQRLREVRRTLREDKEGLGNILFLFNTFFVPVLLIFGAGLYSIKKKKVL
ncbi:MAG TPA: Gldg family protein [Oligoflexia bacterium]|nr:Gldg family protein [Oligoflexia bacterium]HMP47208.1 Gldg family protein [Oligoflexia bacterium]